jgi:hypothetical protein
MPGPSSNATTSIRGPPRVFPVGFRRLPDSPAEVPASAFTIGRKYPVYGDLDGEARPKRGTASVLTPRTRDSTAARELGEGRNAVFEEISEDAPTVKVRAA